MTGAGGLHGGDGLGLVLLDGDDAHGLGEEPQNNLQALHNLPGAGAHQLIVTGDVGLALRAVGNDVVDLLRLLHRQLHMGGEARAAHAHDAGGLHLVQDFLV